MWRSLIVMSTLAAGPAAGACLEYGPITVSGTLVRQTYAGAPDYESVTKGDAPVVIVILQLDNSVCIAGDAGKLGRYATREIQLELDERQLTDYLNLLGNRVSINGQLIQGGAKHDKRLVLAAPQLLDR